jgi:hypothetical protein
MRYKSRHAKRFRDVASQCSGNELVGERDASDVKRGDNRFYRQPYTFGVTGAIGRCFRPIMSMKASPTAFANRR